MAGKLDYVHQAGAYSHHQAGHGAATVQHEYVHQPAAYASHHVNHEAAAPIVKSVSDVSPDGSYGYEYETGNGISAKEHGVGGHSAQGAFSYTAPDGQVVHLSYVADEHGFHPTGSHIPQVRSGYNVHLVKYKSFTLLNSHFQPPPTPAHVLRSLEYIAAHPHQEQKYANVQAQGSAHISAYNNAGHGHAQVAQAYSTGHAQTYNAGHAEVYNAGHTHAQAYNHNAYAHGNAITHQAAPAPYHYN